MNQRFKSSLYVEQDDPNIPVVAGFQEVVFSLTDLEQAKTFYQEVCGWEICWEGQGSDTQISFWQLPDHIEMDTIVLKNPGDETGFLRLVKFHHAEQVQIRSSGHPWDSGGIFDINTRAVDLAQSFRVFQNKGWQGYSDPVRFQFGPFDVSEVAMKGPDGVVIAMAQRHAPPLEGFPNLKKLSHIFNSTHITADVNAAYDFFVHKLGFKVYLEVEVEDRDHGPNVLGIPYNINEQVSLPVYIVHPEGKNAGSVEFLKIKGLEGRNFSDRAIPPNLGILMLRFPVSNARQYCALIQERGVQIHVPLQRIEIPPYGLVELFAIRSPDGVWLEFMETISE